MAEFEFEENNSLPGQNFNAYKNPRSGLTNWLIEKGISKDEKQAFVLMIFIITISIIVSFVIFNYDVSSDYVHEIDKLPPGLITDEAE
jgi:hypothetical protein